MRNLKKSFEITNEILTQKEKTLPLETKELTKVLEMIANDVRLKLYQKSCKLCRSCKSDYDKMIKILQEKNKFVEIEKLMSQLPPKYHEPECYMSTASLNTTNNFYAIVRNMQHEDYI